jgi:hypothetical protein
MTVVDAGAGQEVPVKTPQRFYQPEAGFVPFLTLFPPADQQAVISREQYAAAARTVALPEFEGFAKIPRLSRECIITEKIDGTNAQVYVGEDGLVLAGSKNRWITPGKSTDNFGFAGWVAEHREELRKLGPGRHFGEWWGRGIGRGYGRQDRAFSLFNVGRWADNPELPACCSVVPLLARCQFDTWIIDSQLLVLKETGSRAQPGYPDPEGVVVFHVASGNLYKKTIEHDAEWKGARQQAA